jgi:hypothetical protein
MRVRLPDGAHRREQLIMAFSLARTLRAILRISKELTRKVGVTSGDEQDRIVGRVIDAVAFVVSGASQT